MIAPGFIIRPARNAPEIEAARRLFQDYQAFLAVDLCFQGFAQELAGLPGVYAPPQGELLLAWQPGPGGEQAVLVGGVAVRPLVQKSGDGETAIRGACEMKRLYVYPQFHGQGIGAALVRQIMACAAQLGYQQMVLDTLDRLGEAVALYQRFGFEDVPPYNNNPLPGVRFMASSLPPAAKG